MVVLTGDFMERFSVQYAADWVYLNGKAHPAGELAMEYLTGLGFDLTSLIEEDKNPVTTALAVEVDTRFLFIGGKKDEVE